MMIRCINSPFTDIYFHLAAEEYLLKQGKGDFFMLWQDTSAVVMGKHQRVQVEVDREWAQRQGIQVARRFSGGGTVYHDLGNINLTFIESSSRMSDFTTYLQRTLDLLASVGVKAVGDERLGIYIDGLKVSGSAQCIHKDRSMYHCTLLYDTDLEGLNNVITPKKEMTEDTVASVYGVPSVRSEVANVGTFLPGVNIHSFKKTTFHYFSRGQLISFFTEQEMKAIHQLREEKYVQPKWIFSR